MRAWCLAVVAVVLATATGCPPPPNHPQDPYAEEPAETDDEQPPQPPPAQPQPAPPEPQVAVTAQPAPHTAPKPPPPPQAKLVDQRSDFQFDGGRIDIELRQVGDRLIQTARNRYAVPVVMQWSTSGFVNLMPTGPSDGVVVLPAATKPDGDSAAVEIVGYQILDPTKNFHRELVTRERWGDPRARPTAYAYGLPFAKAQSYSVLQGFHGKFSHRGSNEFAIDFDCPVATSVLATRAGVVVAANEAAQGSGVTAEWADFKRVNFVIILHDDGTLGEYMHLSPSGVIVEAGQRVVRGQPIALSGNTGFSSTPHLHFQVMTAADDGIAARSFPFEIATGPRQVEAPVQGRAYIAWE